MNIETMAATLGIVKKMPDTAASSAAKAETEANRAETAADRAEEYGQRIAVQDNILIVGGDA